MKGKGGGSEGVREWSISWYAVYWEDYQMKMASLLNLLETVDYIGLIIFFFINIHMGGVINHFWFNHLSRVGSRRA